MRDIITIPLRLGNFEATITLNLFLFFYFLLLYLYSINSAICRPSDRTMGDSNPGQALFNLPLQTVLRYLQMPNLDLSFYR